jgi:CheY-like chemotaxis protein
MQNVELRMAQAELDASRTRFFDLYDLAPVGYCTISEKGLILEGNLAASTLLGVARAVMINLHVLKLAHKILDELGYAVLTATTPAEALELAEKHAGLIHLLVTDVIMPEMNGHELANRLQSLCPELKCVFISGYTRDAIARHGVLDKGVNFVQKPFSKRELAITVRKALDEGKNFNS